MTKGYALQHMLVVGASSCPVAMQRQLTHLFFVVVAGGSSLPVASRRCIATVEVVVRR